MDDLGYGSNRARFIALPEPERAGRWWRRGWRLSTTGAPWPDTLNLVEPPEDLGEFTAVVALNRISAVDIRFEVMTPDEALPWNVLAYCAVLAIRLRDQLGQDVLVDGHKKHPLLNMVRLPH